MLELFDLAKMIEIATGILLFVKTFHRRDDVTQIFFVFKYKIGKNRPNFLSKMTACDIIVFRCKVV
jgi:hypothetical protein